jgi:hypothetical protein
VKEEGGCVQFIARTDSHAARRKARNNYTGEALPFSKTLVSD